MLRNNLDNNNSGKIICQIIDWRSYDITKFDDNDDSSEDNLSEDNSSEDESVKKSNKSNNIKFTIRGYGVTDTGNSVCIHIEDFEPYFFFKIPQDWNNDKFNYFAESVKQLANYYQRADLVKYGLVKKKEFYGFTNNELFLYGIFVFKNERALNSYKKIMKEQKIVLKKYNEELDFSKLVYETKVTALLRFFHVQNIDPSAWIEINRYSKNTPSKTRAQIDIKVSYKDINKIEKNSIARIVVASFDIECVSEDGSFPNYNRKNDKVIQIGTTVYIFGENECKYQYIATLNDCDPIENVEVESYQTEKDLILGWARFMERLDPDIITGYNIWGFDWKYLYKRAESGNGGTIKPYNIELFRKLQRLKNNYIHQKIELKENSLSSSALGVNILEYIDIDGIVQFDLYKVVQRDYKLESYKLDNVAKHFMKQQKVDLSPKELFSNFKIGTPDKIKEIAIYCVMDCKLVNELVNRLQVITNNLGMSNVCVVTFSYLFLRGQGIKIFSLVAKFCREENFLIKDLNEDDIDTNSYEGAIVFPPEPGIIFEPVVVMDYNSLYPSSMIAENISHDSIVGYKEYKLKDKKKRDEPDEYILTKDTVKTKYDNLPGYHYIDIDYELFKGSGDDKVKNGYKICRFAEADNGDKSVLPRILRKLLQARKDTRKMMEYYTYKLKDDSEIQGIPTEKEDIIELFNVITGKKIIYKEDVVSSIKTHNEFQLSILDGLQLAYKVTCNSLYGQVGATTSSICYKELAACTTATGRRMVTIARDLTLETFVGAKLTYGDSVTGDTPLLVMLNGFVDIITIENLNNGWVPYNNFKPYDIDRYNKEQSNTNYKIWTNEGWATINRVIRHKTKKRIYRVKTDIGEVDVTEDHSLLDESKNIIKPIECNIGTNLLHSYPTIFPIYEFQELSIFDMKSIIIDLYKGFIDKIPYEILNNTQNNKVQFMKLFIEYYILNSDFNQHSKLFYQSLYYLMKSIEDIFIFDKGFINMLPIKLNGDISVKEIEYLYKSSGYVYDIETESGNFQGGIGQLILKNTDSVFINFTDHIRNKYPDRELTELELLEESIKIGEEAASNINKNVKKPQNIEYEKTFWPFTIFSKKRYIGNKYEHNIKKYKETSMGIVLKRRDNAPIVKTIYGGIMDIILNKRDLEGSKKFFYNSIRDLLDGKVDISQLIISKTVKNESEYSNPNQIAHRVLADRMGERDPGNKPQSNDRIPYAYIDTSNLKCKICSGKINNDNCKCINCMNIYCFHHLKNHRSTCNKVCRFCKVSESELNLKNCDTCHAWYCDRCYERHNLRNDKKTKQIFHDKCKKPLNNKLLQGDMIEHPLYIEENKLKINHKYYLEHQIENPVYQIFALIMKNPESIIEDLLRKLNNTKNGNHSIKDWMAKMNKNINENILAKSNENKFDVKTKLNNSNIDDEEDNILGECFEEEAFENYEIIEEYDE
jgi:DNA polymerase elongation subunit (family B)